MRALPNPWLVVILLTGTIVMDFGEEGFAPGVRAEEPVSWVEYEIDVEKKRHLFESFGVVEIEIPEGYITIVGESQSIYSPNARTLVWNATSAGYVDAGPATGSKVVGRVVSAPQSRADFIFGAAGLLGSVIVDGARYDLNAYKIEGRAIQNVSKHMMSANALIEINMPECDANPIVSRVSMFLEKSFLEDASNPGPTDRVNSAFSKYRQLWCEYNVEIQIFQKVYMSSNVMTSTCATKNFREHIRDNLYRPQDEIDAYQLWTGKNLSGCCGVARSDTAIWERELDDTGWNAASVVEGIDFLDFGCDPDEVHERGILSGTEMGHVYGEECHPQDSSGGTYNLMAGGQDLDDRGFWWATHSKTEMTQWIGSGTDSPGECPD